MKKGNVFWVIVAIIMIIVGTRTFFKGISSFGQNEVVSQTAIINEFAVDENSVAFSVTNVENLKSIGDGYFEVTTEYNFAVVTIKIFNNGTEPYDVNGLKFVLMQGDTEYEYDSDAVIALEDPLYLDTVNPGITKEYTIVYETPVATDNGEFLLKIKPNAFSDYDCVYIALKETK